jgi:hypothetical protein
VLRRIIRIVNYMKKCVTGLLLLKTSVLGWAGINVGFLVEIKIYDKL